IQNSLSLIDTSDDTFVLISNLHLQGNDFSLNAVSSDHEIVDSDAQFCSIWIVFSDQIICRNYFIVHICNSIRLHCSVIQESWRTSTRRDHRDTPKNDVSWMSR